MTERDAFLRAIAADPADDTVRLAFADWLDEHGESARAEFIRIQVKRARSGNKIKSSGLSPREKALLSKHQADWFGPLAGLNRHEGFEYTLRRGFVEAAVIYGRHVNKHASVLRDHCPALTELEIVGVRGFGEHIAKGMPSGIRALRLEDWPFPDDAKALAKSPHCTHLESLSFWLGSENDEAVCRTIAASRAFPALKHVELVQLQGGLDWEDEAAELDASSDRLAALVNSKRKGNVATVTRPCSELLPLAPYVGWNLHSGTVADGRQALIHASAGQCHVFYFDPAGKLQSGEVIDVTGELHKKPDYRGYNEKELCALLAKRIGFRPALIRVHEFSGDQVIPDCWTRIYKYDGNVCYFIGSADGAPAYHGTREEELESVRYWYRGDNFCITHGGDAAWAGADGTIHST